VNYCRPVARIGRAAVSKTACWGFESLPVCHFPDDPFLAERQTRWAQNSVSQDIPVRIRGKGPTDRPHHGSLAQLAEHPALNRQVEGSIPSRSTNSRDAGASSSGRTSRFERENPGSNPGAPATRFRCHVNSAARVLACLARSHGFESRTWRHVQRTDSSVGRAPG
jgi:hypothetical protein